MRQMYLLLTSSVITLMVALTGTVAYADDGAANPVAQSGGLTDTLNGGTPTALPTRTPGTSTAVSSATPTSVAEMVSLTLTLPLTVAEALSSTVPATETTSAPSNLAPAPEGVVAGTVIANRTNALVRFFAEGSTYDIAPLRSAGLALNRPSNVVNVYNCDAALGVNQTGCYWDPYLLERDGFYEIVTGKDSGALKSLILREAGTPPEGQVWIQNRAGREEEVYFGTQMRTLPEGSVELFSVDSAGAAVFYLRTCVSTADGASVCEWASHGAEQGAYYALVEESRPGGTTGTTISRLELQPVLGGAPTAVAGATASALPTDAPQTVCKLAVPALNVRSGPGLGFDIVKKVRSTEVEVATIIVTGRTSAGDWLRVDETIAPGGWVIAGSEYLTCDGEVNALPAVAESELPATPTPLPAEIVPVDNGATSEIGQSQEAVPAEVTTAVDAASTAGVTVTATTTDTPALALPEGTALLTVHNAFDRQVRFTLDQRYRLEQGPSEVDLEPGESTSVIVYAGQIPFTASSPWQGLSGNTSIELAEGEARSVYIVFFWDEVDEKWFLAPV